MKHDYENSSKKLKHLNYSEKRSIFINDDFTLEMSGNIIKKIFDFSKNRNKDPIFIVINSRGGEVRALQNIIAAINASNAPVHTVVVGCAASSAAILFLKGNERIMIEGTELLFHEPFKNLNGNYTYTQLLEALNRAKNIYDLFLDEIVDNTILSKSKIKELIYGGKDYYLSPTEALKIKAATRITKKFNDLL